MCLILLFSLLYTLFMCATVSNLMYVTIIATKITCSLYFSAYNHFVRNNICSLYLYSGDLQTTTVLFTRNASLHKTDWILITLRLFLSCLFICPRKQSDEVLEVECSFSPSPELYIDFIVFYVLYTHCLSIDALLLLVYPFFFHIHS